MPKSLDDLKKALAALTDGPEYLEGLDAALEAHGIKSKSDANQEAKGLRIRAKAAEGTLKKLGEKLGVDLSGDDLDDKIEDLATKFKAPPKAGDGKGAEDPETKAWRKKIEKELEDSKAATKAALDEANAEKTITFVTNFLTQKGVNKEQLSDYVKLLAKEVRISPDKKFLSGDENDPIMAEEFLTDFVKARPGILDNPARPGAGNQKQVAKSGPSETPNTSKLSPTDKMAAGFALQK